MQEVSDFMTINTGIVSNWRLLPRPLYLFEFKFEKALNF
jgi:hypothetical protein